MIPNINVDGYNGPIDLLLDLAKRQDRLLEKISFSQLADQFIEIVQDALANKSTQLTSVADWIVMVSWITLIRSKLLCPKNEEEQKQAESDAERMIAILQEQETMRMAARWLAERPYMGIDWFTRPEIEEGDSNIIMDRQSLFEACLAVMNFDLQTKPKAEPPSYQIKIPDLWRPIQAREVIEVWVSEHKTETTQLISLVPKKYFGQDSNVEDHQHKIRTRQKKAAIASTLVAALDLAKEGTVRLDQTVLLSREDQESPIYLTSNGV